MPAERSLASEIAEIKDDLKAFVQTRAQLLRAETAEKLRVWKSSAILLALAAVFLISGWFSLVFGLVSLFHAWLVSTGYEWFWGATIVSAVFLVAGVACGRSGYRRIRSAGVTPRRTLEILKQDQEWIHKEARSA